MYKCECVCVTYWKNNGDQNSQGYYPHKVVYWYKLILVQQCSFTQTFNEPLLFARYRGYNGKLDNLFIGIRRVSKYRE